MVLLMRSVPLIKAQKISEMISELTLKKRNYRDTGGKFLNALALRQGRRLDLSYCRLLGKWL